ncbi:RrF2 family transcriptional regulator [Oxalobacter formigenes]|uniref:Transcriptional regulator, Rrf2 family n=2 Tax=Oxalobacter formigenes TaxID=847 RepID=C3X9X0_OXAFO|nr:Rrf2 family transcriptional regulator [Oxalobacter formigenes]ARQ78088.1 transcriptional regulator [Oxalobacter formigenes OXCC13]EEO29996.1 transcriptional regulator, Rrf2 family [Oxalobacter formigenes OXCC13]WAW02502.1 Rrf2 family transcriptional regulator [Oxalobacter formigenes]WAW02768.1 Rrf2 family transcriptional regulator [Oxalobacter formigenes]WAW06805.1 Rrf2 family transcriptional regulator [Oxalobacter formigenes]
MLSTPNFRLSGIMKLSTHTRYAIRILFELHLARGPISIAALSELTNIGLKTVENIHAVLRQNDITASIIGAHGGIRLNKPLSAISLGKMIELFDEGVRFVVCFGEKSNDCPRQNVCETRSVWKTISGQIQKELDTVSLEAILDQYREENTEAKPVLIHCLNRKSDIILENDS